MKNVLLSFTALTMLVSCAPKPGQNLYSASEVGQDVRIEFGRVVSVRKVEIRGENTGTGAAAGATAGAVAGYQVGNGNGQLAATLGAMVAGAIIGGMAEQAMQDGQGYKYIIVTDKKKTRSIVQYQNESDVVFKKGDRVMIETEGKFQRVVPTDDLPEQTKRARGVKVVD